MKKTNRRSYVPGLSPRSRHPSVIKAVEAENLPTLDDIIKRREEIGHQDNLDQFLDAKRRFPYTTPLSPEYKRLSAAKKEVVDWRADYVLELAIAENDPRAADKKDFLNHERNKLAKLSPAEMKKLQEEHSFYMQRHPEERKGRSK